MDDNLPPVTSGNKYRIFANHDGEVYLLWEKRNRLVKVERPVTSDTLSRAQSKLHSESSDPATNDTRDKPRPKNTARADAICEIEQTLFPLQKGPLLHRLKNLFEVLFEHVLTLVLVLFPAYPAYRAVQISSERFPVWAHLVVLVAFALALSLIMLVIAAQKGARPNVAWFRLWFGRRGLLALPVLILLVAGSVFASFTFTLFKNGRVILEPCAGRAVSEGTLLDFYMWHFMKLIPLLDINRTLKWNEPLCYSQARVGFLILLFQAAVVLPGINTVRFYWKHRESFERDFAECIYDPDWTPTDLKSNKLTTAP